MKLRTAFGQHTLAGEYFTSEEIFAEERERIFRRSWLLAGHVSQLATPGSYFLFELDRESVIVLRDARRGGPRLPQPLPPPRQPALPRDRRASWPTPSSARTTPGPTASTARCAPRRT